MGESHTGRTLSLNLELRFIPNFIVTEVVMQGTGALFFFLD